MIITSNTGAEKQTVDLCKCGHDYGGDRIILEDSTFVPILGGERQFGLDFSSFFKNISQSNLLKFKLSSKQSRLISDIDGTGMKFIAVSVVDPTQPLYWRKTNINCNNTDPIQEFVTAILNGSFKITTDPFTSDRINAVVTMTLDSDNSFKMVTWTNIGASFIDGKFTTTWLDGQYSWNDYHPLLTTNTQLVVVNNVISAPVVIENDNQMNFSGEVTLQAIVGSTAINVTLKFSGVYGDTFVVNSIIVGLDGHLVGPLFMLVGQPIADFTTIPLEMEVNFTFTGASGLIEEYDKIVGMMVLTSTDNEPLKTIKLYNGGIKSVQVATMIGS